MKAIKLLTLHFLILRFLSGFAHMTALAQDVESDMSNPGYQSYLAHIAAANASLRLNEPVEARRWLELAPAHWRGWEYRYLMAMSDKSLGVFDSLSSQPMSQDYSSDGRFLATACEDSTVRIYDLESSKVKVKLAGHRGAVYSAQFFPGGEKILTCSRDSLIRTWNIEGELLNEANAGGHGLQYADISPAGDRIAYASWKRTDTGVIGIVSLWDANTFEKTWETDFDVKPIVKVKFSPDGSQFAVGTWGWKVGVWETANPVESAVFDFDDVPTYSAIDDIAFSPDGKKIAAASRNGSPRVWSLETGEKILELHGHDKPVMSITFSPDGNQIYTGGSDASVAIWNADTGIKLGRLFGHGNSVNSIEFRPIERVSGAAGTSGARTLSTISSD
ncbi:MAG: WD40 repeat domain-containing protein, partial [Candidatus Zixiibacteriota bacterium]